MSTSTAVTIITDLIADIGAVLSQSLVVVFSLVGVLIGLFFVFRVVRSKIGGGKK